MESSNAWERAQEAITRAQQRDADVVTPDNAVSPFDAAATTIIARPGADDLPPEAAVTQRFACDPAAVPARRTSPEDDPDRAGRHRPPGSGEDPTGADGTDGSHRSDEADGPATDTLPTADLPGTSPFAAVAPDDTDGRWATPEPQRAPWWRRLFGRR